MSYKRKTPRRTLWGFNTAQRIGLIRICEYSKAEQERRTREGWTCAGVIDGEEPTELRALHQAARAAACFACGTSLGVRVVMVEGHTERACIACIPPETPRPVHVEHKPGRGWESMFETIARPAVKDVQNQTFIPGFEPTPTRASAKRANDRRQGRLWG